MEHYRFVIMGIVFLCLTSIASNYIVLNFTFICMKDDPTGIRDIGNKSINIFAYTQAERSQLIWAVAIGTTLGTLPINYLMIIHGARWICLICTIVSAIASLLSPFLASRGLWPFLFARFLQGISYAADFAAVGAVIVRWVPSSEYAIFISILTAFTPISSFATNFLTGFLCQSSFGWRSSFYLHSAFGFIIAILWFIFFTDGPATNRFTSQKEIDLIHGNKSMTEIENSAQIPYKVEFYISPESGSLSIYYSISIQKILQNWQILAVWINAFGEHVTVNLLFTYAPVYFNSVLKFDVSTTGLLASLIGLVQIPFKILCAVLSDKIKFISEKNKMLCFNFLSVCCCGVICISLGFFDQNLRIWSIVGFFLFSTLASSNSGGFYKGAIFVARQYAHFVISMIQFMKCLALFICPALVAIFVKEDHDISQWRIVFLLAGTYMILSHFIFWAFHSDEAADFTKMKVEEENRSKIELENQNVE